MKVPSVQNQMMKMNARAAQAKETSPVGNACAMTALMKIRWECALIVIQSGPRQKSHYEGQISHSFVNILP